MEKAAKENRGRATIDDLWKSVEACIRVAEAEEEYVVGQRLFGRSESYYLPTIRENLVLQRAEGAVLGPGD